MGEYSHLSQTFMPVYDETSKVLILGSFPSVKSREQGFYYGHLQNRFWKVVVLPSTSPANAACLLDKLIEVWREELQV